MFSCFFQLCFHVSVSCVPRFSLVLVPGDRLGSHGGNVGNACEEFRSMRVAYWVNVSESSGSTGLSEIKGH